MIEEPLNNKNLEEQLTFAQLQKLNLEIEALRNKNYWANRIIHFIPLITTLIAVAGFFFTVNQFIIQQKKDLLNRVKEQEIKDENQIRVDINQLINLTNDNNQTTASVIFLLEDLKILIKRSPSEKQKITDVLIKFIEDDCNFDNIRHVRIDVAAINCWNDYQQYLKDNREVNRNIIYKYSQSLRHVHDEDKSYFDQIKYESGYGYRVPYYTEESRYLRFIELIKGFSLHLRIIENQPNDVKAAIQQFQEAMNNPKLTKQLIEAKLLPFPREERGLIIDKY